MNPVIDTTEETDYMLDQLLAELWWVGKITFLEFVIITSYHRESIIL